MQVEINKLLSEILDGEEDNLFTFIEPAAKGCGLTVEQFLTIVRRIKADSGGSLGGHLIGVNGYTFVSDSLTCRVRALLTAGIQTVQFVEQSAKEQAAIEQAQASAVNEARRN